MCVSVCDWRDRQREGKSEREGQREGETCACVFLFFFCEVFDFRECSKSIYGMVYVIHIYQERHREGE